MKRLSFIFVLFILTFVFSEANPRRQSYVNYDVFYESLSPFGEWIEIDYDLVVWRPTRIDRDWAPYKRGQWMWTSDGWYWDSYEPFGWATYHYGRWHYDDYYGWLWFPDNKWAPAWVEWRYNDDYVGWAPLTPYAQFKIGFGIRFTHKWRHHHHHWHFVNIHQFHGHDVYNHIVHHDKNRNILRNTKYRTNYSYRNGRIVNGGINREFVERRSNRRINERNLVTTRTHFNRNDRKYRDTRSIDVYKPNLDSRKTNRSKIEITKSKRSINIERSKIITRKKDTYSERKRNSLRKSDDKENSRSSGRKLKSTRNSKKREISSSTQRESEVKKQTNRRNSTTERYNKNESNNKRHSRKSSGKSSSRVRESKKENDQRHTRTSSNSRRR